MKTSLLSPYSFFIYLSLVLLISSCSQTVNHENPAIDPELVLKDFRTWWDYNYRNIKLSENYTAFDTSLNPISKETFLKSLSSGEYVAFRLNTTDPLLKYKLYKLSPHTDSFTRAQAKQFGEDGYQKYKMEGTEIPDFNFTDLNGKVYNSETTKGKIVVLKCWFIHCTVCVQEMPALNAVVNEFKNRSDVLFISLAFDPKEKLEKFLATTKFNYAVIPVKQEYMQEKLKVTGYPTQFIINRRGSISKVITDYHDMISALKNELSK